MDRKEMKDLNILYVCTFADWRVNTWEHESERGCG